MVLPTAVCGSRPSGITLRQGEMKKFFHFLLQGKDRARPQGSSKTALVQSSVICYRVTKICPHN